MTLNLSLVASLLTSCGSWLARIPFLCLMIGLVELSATGSGWAQTPAAVKKPVPAPVVEVLATAPKDQQKEISINATVQVKFNQVIKANLQQLQLGITPPTEVSFTLQLDRLVVQPAKPLLYSTDYTVTLPRQAGIPLAKPLQFKFRTEPQYTYNTDIKPLLEASCVGCHGQLGRISYKSLETYSATMAYVKPGDAGSELIAPQWTQLHAPIRSADRPDSPPGGGSPELAYVLQKGTSIDRLGKFSPEEIEQIRIWIVQDLAPESKNPVMPTL